MLPSHHFPYGISLSVKDCPLTPTEVEEMKKIPYQEVLGVELA